VFYVLSTESKTKLIAVPIWKSFEITTMKQYILSTVHSWIIMPKSVSKKRKRPVQKGILGYPKKTKLLFFINVNASLFRIRFNPNKPYIINNKIIYFIRKQIHSEMTQTTIIATLPILISTLLKPPNKKSAHVVLKLQRPMSAVILTWSKTGRRIYPTKSY